MFPPIAAAMTSSRPYLIRALYDWIVDNHLTPYLLVNAEVEGVEVPPQHVEDGKVVLNVAPQAVRGLELGNDLISFGTRFSGAPTQVRLPTGAVLAIYARENGQGMLFAETEPGAPPEPPTGAPPRRPALKVIK